MFWLFYIMITNKLLDILCLHNIIYGENISRSTEWINYICKILLMFPVVQWRVPIYTDRRWQTWSPRVISGELISSAHKVHEFWTFGSPRWPINFLWNSGNFKHDPFFRLWRVTYFTVEMVQYTESFYQGKPHDDAIIALYQISINNPALLYHNIDHG